MPKKGRYLKRQTQQNQNLQHTRQTGSKGPMGGGKYIPDQHTETNLAKQKNFSWGWGRGGTQNQLVLFVAPIKTGLYFFIEEGGEETMATKKNMNMGI